MGSNHRSQQIEQIVSELRSARSEAKDADTIYAIDENIAFFEAIRSVPAYLHWLISRMPRIDGDRLLEVNDILPQWDDEVHRRLIDVEKKKFPGLIEPLVGELEP